MEERQFRLPECIHPYISQNTIDLAAENVVRSRTTIEEWLSPHEFKSMAIQSLLIWEKPWKSAVFLFCAAILLW